LAGAIYSDVPYREAAIARSSTRQIGLGLMGISEWLYQRGKRYDIDDELGQYPEVYKNSTSVLAEQWAEYYDINPPARTRCIAPNGTTSIVAETTGGIEPIFCVAYKRRYLRGEDWHYQYVIDPTARRLIDQGIPIEQIEDSYQLATDLHRRLRFQQWIQTFVDNGISSTINLPAWGSDLNNEYKMEEIGTTILQYLPYLRGITVYPDGGRSGQPITPVPYDIAVKHEAQEFAENICFLRGGNCGD